MGLEESRRSGVAKATRPRADALLPIVTAALTCMAVAWPLVAPGYLQLLDAPTGPDAVFPSFFPLPSEGVAALGLPSSALFRAALGLFHEIAPSAVNKALVLAALSLSVFSCYHLARTRFDIVSGAAALGALFYAVNPFTHQRLISGQLYLMLGYALLPFAVAAVVDLVSRASMKNGARAATWSAGLLLVSPHIGVVAAVLAIVGCAVATGSWFDRGRAVSLIGVGTLGVGAFWILPSLERSASASTSLADLQVFASQPRGWGSLVYSSLLHGFWRNEFHGPLESQPALFLAAAVVLGACIVVGLRRLSPRREVLFLTIAAGGALILSVSTSLPPMRAVSRWAFSEFRGLHLFREPNKWLVVVCLVYAIGIGGGVQSLLKPVRARIRMFLTVLFAGLIALATYPMLWGFGGRVVPSDIPGALLDVRSKLETPGRTLFLPWHEFMPYAFAQGRTIGDIAPYLFGSEVISSDSDDFLHRAAGDELDPRNAYLRILIEQRGLMRRFGALIAPLGIRYVVLVHTADFRAYGFLERQRDLTPVSRGDHVSIYENRSWKDQIVVTGGVSFRSIDRMLASRASQNAATTALVTISNHEPIATPRWSFHSRPRGRLEVPSGKTLITPLSCRDGFVVDGEPPACHLGALAAFTSTGELLLPRSSLRLVGYGISFVTALVLIASRLYASRWT
jgi:hypothetical protein